MNDLFLLLVGALIGAMIGAMIGLTVRGSSDYSETLAHLERMRKLDNETWKATFYPPEGKGQEDET